MDSALSSHIIVRRNDDFVSDSRRQLFDDYLIGPKLEFIVIVISNSAINIVLVLVSVLLTYIHIYSLHPDFTGTINRQVESGLQRFLQDLEGLL